MPDPVPLRSTSPDDGVAVCLLTMMFEHQPAPVMRLLRERQLLLVRRVDREIDEDRVQMGALVQRDVERAPHDHLAAQPKAPKPLHSTERRTASNERKPHAG